MRQNDLEILVEKVVRRVLNEKFSNKLFDISHIDINDLKQIYRDLRLNPTLNSHTDILNRKNVLRESFGDILPPDEVVNKIIQRYHFPESTVFKMEASNYVSVYIIIADIGTNIEIVEEDMRRMGYFLGSVDEIQNVGNMSFRLLQFEPVSSKQEDKTIEVKNRYNYLLHWTPQYELSSILRKGLIPSHKNNSAYFPPRIYLIKPDVGFNTLEQLGQGLSTKNTNPNNNGNYCLLKVDISNLNDDVKFFDDPNCIGGLYTGSPISAENIEFINIYRFPISF